MKASDIVLRLAEPSDADVIAAIYAPYVRETAISFEIDPPSPEVMARRIESVLECYPWLVAVRGSTVVGYAYADKHRERAAYRWSVDVTIYLAAAAQGQGIGRTLYAALIAILGGQGFHAAFAGITLPNGASVGLHQAVGFAPVGVYRNVGFKLGRWHDVGWWGLELTAGAETPAEPIGFQHFRQTSSFKSVFRE